MDNGNLAEKQTNRRLRKLLFDSIDFSLYSCGVTPLELPYSEPWTVLPNGHFSQIIGAGSRVFFMDRNFSTRHGDCLIFPANIAFRVETEKTLDQQRMTCRWMHFQFFLMRTIDIFSFFELPFLLHDDAAMRFGNLAEEMTAIQNDTDLDPLIATVRQKRIVYELLDALFELVPLKKNYSIEILDDLYTLAPVLKYIDENFTQDIPVKVLAKLKNQSVSHFHAYFSRIMKLPPKQYIIQLRLKKAQTLLYQSDLSIKQIAGMCGYDDQMFFAKVFKQHLRQTPSDYRRQGLGVMSRLVSSQTTPGGKTGAASSRPSSKLLECNP